MEEKTTLQRIMEQLEEKMTRAIVQAIENGPKCKIFEDGGLRIDEVYLTPKFGTDYHGLILNINAPEIEQLLKQKKEDLEERAKELRAELEEIEKQIKSE